MTNKRQINVQAFTLVELSIVIIIIGFLIAGVSAGTSLIQQAKLNAVISEATSYRSVFNTFISRFGYIPGDFPNAYAFWGSLPGTTCTNNDVNLVVTGCNGNGNGVLDWWAFEGILVWEQLAFAGLVPGAYTVNPAATMSIADTVIGVNVPASKYPNAGYHLYNVGTSAGQLQIGAYRQDDRPDTNVLTSTDAASIDLKSDDGNPSTGSVIAQYVYGYPENTGSGPNGTYWQDYCTDGGDNYLLSTPGIICRLAWVNLTNP